MGVATEFLYRSTYLFSANAPDIMHHFDVEPNLTWPLLFSDPRRVVDVSVYSLNCCNWHASEGYTLQGYHRLTRRPWRVYPRIDGTHSKTTRWSRARLAALSIHQKKSKITLLRSGFSQMIVFRARPLIFVVVERRNPLREVLLQTSARVEC